MLRNPEKTMAQRVLWPFWVLVYWCSLLITVLFTLVINLSCVLTSLLPAGTWRYGFYQGMLRTMIRVFFGFLGAVGILRIRYVGFDAIDTKPGTVKPILVANHPNLLDIFLFYAKLPRLTCIYKASLQKTLIQYSMGAQVGFISNINPKHMIAEAAKRVRAGEQMVIFPEGTRTDVWPLNDLKSGAVGIARRADVALQTVVIDTGSNFLAKRQSLYKPPILPICVHVEVGECFHQRDYESRQALNSAMADYFIAQLKVERVFA